MLRRRPSRDALWERLLEERDRQIRILVAEIDWLRAQLGRPSLPAAINPSELPPVEHEISDGGWLSEREEAERIATELGLSNVHLPEILDGLGYGSADL
ncbi:MAG: hypothetical protein ACM3S1_10470 [Hyphomicrobiales bacterium]